MILKYLMMLAGFAMFGTTAGVVGYDVWLATLLENLVGRRHARVQLDGCSVRPQRLPQALGACR
jgi:hypothetical protein